MPGKSKLLVRSVHQIQGGWRFCLAAGASKGQANRLMRDPKIYCPTCRDIMLAVDGLEDALKHLSERIKSDPHLRIEEMVLSEEAVKDCRKLNAEYLKSLQL